MNDAKTLKNVYDRMCSDAAINNETQLTHQTNCHNCGAIITGPKCEYCGTVFDLKALNAEPVTLISVDLAKATDFTHMFNAGLISPNEARRGIGIL